MVAAPEPTIGKETTGLRWLISQIGSRERYACPVGFARRGNLRRFYTDAWCSSFRGLMSRMPGSIRGLSQRFHPELPRDKVTAFTAATMANELHDKAFRKDRSRAAEHRRYEDLGKWFASRVARDLGRMKLDPKCDVHFAYDTGALESLMIARDRGILGMVDQIDAAKVHEQAVREERDRWPGWEAQEGQIPPSYHERLAKEWETAEMVVVNSNYSRRAIGAQGVPLEKIVVVPLAYETDSGEAEAPKRRSSRDKPLEVLWLGQVALAKGIAYFFEAARLLAAENIRFTCVGKVRISEKAIKSAPANIRMVGPVLHEDTLKYYREADVFVLPTISDGFAITQIEAMSHGLPVITTPNCGDVVTPGEDGWIVPVRDSKALAAAIGKCERERERLEEMSRRAVAKSAEFTLERYTNALEAAVLTHRNKRVVNSAGGENGKGAGSLEQKEILQ